MPRPMTKHQNLTPGEEASVTVKLKSLRNPPLDITLPIQPVSSTILELKQAASEKTSIPIDKIRLLYKKKPCSDQRSIKDLIAGNERHVEFSVMVMGGTSAAAQDTGEKSGSAEGPQASPSEEARWRELVNTDGFWEDLNGFLLQRLNNEYGAGNVLNMFRKAWEESLRSQGL